MHPPPMITTSAVTNLIIPGEPFSADEAALIKAAVVNQTERMRQSRAMRSCRLATLFALALAVVASQGCASLSSALQRQIFIPKIPFATSPVDDQPDYTNPRNWVAHPADNDSPALDTPPGVQPASESLADVFYITPTTWLDGSRWNAPLDDRETNEMLMHTVRGQASAFNSVGDVWAPRYRQATYGAFLTYEPDAARALALAETDVLAAFDVFLTARAARAGGRNRPFVLAGHSQGALHLAQLLKKRISNTPLQANLVAAYVIGWPVSLEHDLAALPDLDSCRGPDDTGCVIGWMTFGTSPDTGDLFDCFDHQVGLDGILNTDSQMLCVNPLTWRQDTTPAPASANLGSLTPVDTGHPIGALETALVGATCRADGVLELSQSPQGPWREWVSGDEDYHVYDVNLFWANIRDNVRHRVNAHLRR